MSFLGFGQKWRNWVSALWGTTSSSVLLNGEPDRRILHCRGVRQGDPLSPMLFLLAMEPLHMLFNKAQATGLLQNLSSTINISGASLYADNAAVFIHLAVKELKVTDLILQLFADASGLNTNMAKTSYYPIQCANMDLEFLANAGRIVSTLPCMYLGLSLGTKKPSKAMLQQLIQKIGNRLPGWKRKYLTYPGRELLVKMVLSAMPTHYLMVFKMPKWAIAGVDRFRRGFL
jgi:hypothetical protein